MSRLLRTFRVSAVIAVAFALLSQSGAYAATVNVSMTSSLRFSPDPAKAMLGDTIKWTNTSTLAHTSTQNTPLALWDSGSVPAGGTFSFTITAAGLYPYHCTFHQASGMVGTAGARDIVTPPFGPIGTQFTVKVATVTAPAGFVYDIQKANPGGGFTDWMTGVTSTSKTWDSTGQAAGMYKFRSRLRNTSTGATSGYSPAFTIQIR